MRRTQTHTIMPWIGGVNTSVDSGVLNPQELVKADNVVFSSTGARVKREAYEYLESGVPAPDYRSSSGTTRTLKWVSSALVHIASLDEKLVTGELITVTGSVDYAADAAPILSRSSISQVTTILCTADVSGSLAGKYFLISAGDDGSDYYVWYKVSGVGVDPSLANAIGVEVDISTNATNSAVASATRTTLDALLDFAASVSTATVTVTNAVGGLTAASAAGTSGFTLTDTTRGGHSITYTGPSSLSESLTATSALTVARASAVISYTDYWYYDTDASEGQLGVFATDNFQLFTLDDAGRRVQIHGQGQVQEIITPAASAITTGDYFLLFSANNETTYYVWYNKAAGGGDPALSNKTPIPVAIGGGDTAAQVATATAAAIALVVADFTASALSTTVTVTNVNSGLTNPAADVNADVIPTVTIYGATAPTTAIETIRTLVFNEDCKIFFSGIGNYPIAFNPNRDAKYQLLDPNCPDAEFGISYLSRIWVNDKTNRGRMHYSAPFDESQWLGIGDSGAIDIYAGDGDPKGIINAYPYKGMLVVGKKAKRYRVTGEAPEDFFPEIISEGIGNEGPLFVPVDESDVVFMSRRGVHSQETTTNYGDTDAAYLSEDIKPTFNSWEPNELKNTQGVYLPELNSIALSITENGHNSPNAIWLYNTEVAVPGKPRPGAWYRWPNVSCTALARRYTNSKYRLVIGTEDGRIIQAQVSRTFADFDTDGIPFVIRSGSITCGDPQKMKAFKRISMIYRPRGNFSFAVKVYVDNQRSQLFSFNQISGLDTLGETFVLGTSLLGSSATLAPFSFTMEGLGRGIVLEITQPSANEQVEIWGFTIEYEDADIIQSSDGQ